MDTRVVIDSPYLIALLVALFGYLIYQGRIAASLGAFYAASNWIFNADLGSVALLKIFLVVMACSACVAVVRKRSRLGHALRSPGVTAAVLLVVFWMLTITLKAMLTADDLPREMLIGFFTYTGLPTALLVVFINDVAGVKELAIGFIICAAGTAVGSVLIVPAIFLGQLGLVLGLGGGEYLSFSWGLSMGVLFGMGAFFVSRRRGLKAIFLTLAGLCGTVLMMTAARQSVLALGTALAYVFWVIAWKHGKGRAVLAIAVVLVGLGSIMYFGTNLGQGLLSEKWSKSDDDATIRENYWRAGWNVFLDHPSTGAGLRYMPDETDSAHNLFIDILASQGILGLLFLCAFASLTLASFRKQAIYAMGPEAHLWRTILVSILIFTAVHSFASGSMIAEPEFFWVPFLLMLLVSIAETEKGPKHMSPSITGPDTTLGAIVTG